MGSEVEPTYTSVKMEVDGDIENVKGVNSSKGKSRRRKPLIVDLTGEKDGEDVEDEPMQTEGESIGLPRDESSEEEVKIVDHHEPACGVEIADNFKNMGNAFYKSQEYHKALEMYSKAIGIHQFESSYYGNRCACYLMMGKYSEAQTDARKSVQLDSKFEKGYQRLFRSTLYLGDLSACDTLVNVINGLPEDVKIDVSAEMQSFACLKGLLIELEKDLIKSDYRKALYTVNLALNIACGDLNLTVSKANILFNLSRLQDANDIAVDVLQRDNKLVEAWHVASKCNYQFDNYDKAITFLKRALHFAPDSIPIQAFYRRLKQLNEYRSKGRENFTGNNLESAKLNYSEALRLTETDGMKNPAIQSKLLYNLSLIAQKMKATDEALELCTKAIDLNPKYLKAFVSRANLHSIKGMFEESVRDYESASKLDPGSKEWKRLIQETSFAAKKAKRKDYYKILGVERSASADEMKKAYKKQALLCHPDRHSSATELVLKDQERQFKELGEAYEILTDPKKRSRYDLGEDLNDTPTGFEAFDASQIFNAFYTNIGGPSSRHHNHGPGYHHYRTYAPGPGGCFNPR